MGMMSGKYFIHFNVFTAITIGAVAVILEHIGTGGLVTAASGAAWIILIDLYLIHKAGNLRRLFGYAIPYLKKRETK